MMKYKAYDEDEGFYWILNKEKEVSGKMGHSHDSR